MAGLVLVDAELPAELRPPVKPHVVRDVPVAYGRAVIGWDTLPEKLQRENRDLTLDDVLRVQHLLGQKPRESGRARADMLAGVPVDPAPLANVPRLVVGSGPRRLGGRGRRRAAGELARRRARAVRRSLALRPGARDGEPSPGRRPGPDLPGGASPVATGAVRPARRASCRPRPPAGAAAAGFANATAALVASCPGRGSDGSVRATLPHSSRGPGRRPLKAEITGSNPVCGTNRTSRRPRSAPRGRYPFRRRAGGRQLPRRTDGAHRAAPAGDPDRGRVRPAPRQDRVGRHPLRSRRDRGHPRLDDRGAQRERVAARPRHPGRGHARRGARDPRPAAPGHAPHRHRADRRPPPRRSGARSSSRRSARAWSSIPGSTRSSATTRRSRRPRRRPASGSSTTVARRTGWSARSAGGTCRAGA